MKARLLSALLLVAVLPLAAQNDEPEEGPGRGVARISLINGDVSVRRGDTGDLTAAAINAPLVVEDRVLTGAGSRAEVQFDYANILRLAGDSEVRLAELEQARYIVRLASGTITFRVLRDSNADVEISTPSISVRPAKRGVYRISVRPDGSTEVTVRSGEAEIFTPTGSQRLRSGRTMLARGPVSDPEFQMVAAAREDDWDRWNERRDRDLERSVSYRYVSRDIYGAEDLDAYGRWVNVPPYGWVWSPVVAAGWAPYRLGRWAWLDWYGWSWVSYDPWGWAPYHYGRWFYNAPFGWCWWPGAMRSRHYWRPALVGFFGWGGGGFGVSVGFGGGFGRIGWCPLAPYERYRPWYGSRYYGGFRNRGYVDNSVNIVNNVNITNVYRNARVRDSMTIVNGDDFRAGRINRLQNLSDNDLRRASMVQGQVLIVPGRESLRLADRDPGRTTTPGGSANERFFSRREPARIDRVSFDDQRRGMEQVARRSFGEEQGRSLRSEAGAPVRGAESNPDGAGWRRGGEGAPTRESAGIAAEQATRQAGESERGGWRRFGEPSRSRAGETAERSDPALTRGADPSGGGRGAEVGRDGWRRFGEPSRSRAGETTERGDPALSRGSEVRGGGRSAESGRDGWNRLGEPSQNRRSEPAVRDNEGAGWRRWNDSAPAETRSNESVGGRGREGGSRRSDSWIRGESPRDPDRSGESVRIAPPIVRERNSRTYDEGFGRSSGMSGGRSGGEFGGRRMESMSPPSMRGGGGEMRGGGGMPRGGGGEMRGGGGGMTRGGGGEMRGGGGGGGRSGGGGGGRGR